MKEEREGVLSSITEAQSAGARLARCCALVGLDVRTVQRWRRAKCLEDRRRGPLSAPSNRLTPAEREKIIDVATSPMYRGLSPHQIVPLLADKGIYLGSESSFYRVLKEEGLQHHRENSKPSKKHRPKSLTATGPNQVWSWDITYMKGPIKGQFFYLYLFMDIWSRKIVGWRVENNESSELAGELMAAMCAQEGIPHGQVSLHSDNGSPMRGATMLATLQALGVVASFSRPSVSNDNPYSESLFRTLKYRPGYPSRGFVSVEAARTWVDGFVDWYNERHLHSQIRYVTASARHCDDDIAILAHRRLIYQRARAANPTRWTGASRNWSRPGTVVLNPSKQSNTLEQASQC